MNKQALAFLTMFSLVLMLSVYYVTLPNDSTSVVTTDQSKNQEQANKSGEDSADTSKADDTKDNKQEETSSVDAAAALQEEIDQSMETNINKNNDIIANKDSEEEAKKSALEALDSLKAQKELQTSIKEALAKEKINVAVEIKDTTCTISVFDQKEDKTLATSIMKIANSLTNNKYLIEVTFK